MPATLTILMAIALAMTEAILLLLLLLLSLLLYCRLFRRRAKLLHLWRSERRRRTFRFWNRIRRSQLLRRLLGRLRQGLSRLQTQWQPSQTQPKPRQTQWQPSQTQPKPRQTQKQTQRRQTEIQCQLYFNTVLQHRQWLRRRKTDCKRGANENRKWEV